MSTTAYSGGIRASGKPRSPLQISISPVQSGLSPIDIKPGDVVEFKIIGKTHTDAAEVRIKIELLGGVQLLSGNTTWAGPALRGEDKSLLITVGVPRHGNGMIRAQISMSPSSGSSFASEAEYRFGKYAEKKPVLLPEIKKDSKGRAIREHRVN
jgi:hypothetical protein